MIPKTKYAKSGDLNIAYQVIGNGPRDLVLVPGWISNLDVFWEEPSVVRFFERLAGFARVILFDKRGTGLSDRLNQPPTLEERMDDVRAVMDAVGSQRASLLGYSEGGPMSILFATTYPERTDSLVLLGSYARNQYSDDYPTGRSRQNQDEVENIIRSDWGAPVLWEARMPSLAHDQRLADWFGKFCRSGASPTMALMLVQANYEIDVRHLLRSVRVPTLLVHARRDQTISLEASRYMQQRIPDAKLIELDSSDHLGFFWGDADPTLSAIEEFLTGERAPVEPDRVVCTIMFTDIVDSTKRAAALGDARWRDLLGQHHKAIRRELTLYRGRELNTMGDGFYAGFDGPARAITCGAKLVEAVKPLDLSIRVGIHTGECELRDGETTGLAIHIGARVCSAASADTVLVSQTVKDLVAGSGIEFADFGSHTLKGVPEPVHLYNVKAIARRA